MRAVLLTVADPLIGLGHLCRCDALATALADRGSEVSLVVHCRAGDEWLASRAPENPWTVRPWSDDAAEAEAAMANADRVIVDAYDVDASVRATISDAIPDPVYFDDYGSNIPERGVVINGSPGAHLIDYPYRARLVLLLGPRYQVLRKPFWQPTRRTIPERVESVGVILGGTDYQGLMDAVLPLVRDAAPAETKVYAIGVEPEAIRHSGVQGTGRLTAKGMKELFDRLDLLVSAAGQTVAEAVSCKLPTVMIQTAENQRYNVEGWAAASSSVSAGWHSSDGFLDQLHRCILVEASYHQRTKRRHKMEAFDLQRSTWRVADHIVHGRQVCAS